MLCMFVEEVPKRQGLEHDKVYNVPEFTCLPFDALKTVFIYFMFTLVHLLSSNMECYAHLLLETFTSTLLLVVPYQF